MRHSIGFALFILFSFVACSKNMLPPDSNFVGTWKLDKIETLDHESGKWNYDSAFADWTGYITYDGQGHMGVQITPKGYKDFDANTNLDSLTNTELKAVIKFYQSNWVYFASYKITGNTIEHLRLSATDPKDWGTTLTRDFEFNGDTLEPVRG